MKRTFRVVTEKRFCKETGRPPCHNKPYGYVIQVIPPIVSFKVTDDVEGIGMVHFKNPKRWEQHTAGWCKHRSIAQVRLGEVMRSEYYNRDDQQVPKIA